MRYAAIDIGTNSCRLLIADKDKEHNRLIPVYKDLKTTRLGEGVNARGTISVPAMQRTIDCLAGFQQCINEYQAHAWEAVATSAVRDADNRDEFIAMAANQCSLPIRILDGQEEAYLSYTGVKNGLKLEHPPLVVDLGGGSTEFILEDKELFLLSLPLGAVRVTEAKMPISTVAKILSPVAMQKARFNSHPLVFVGGTATTIVAIKLSLEEYRSELIHGEVLDRCEVADIYNMLERLPLTLRKRLPGLQPERADIIPAGAMVMLLIMDTLGKKEIIVSESDLLEGVIWEMN
ncbi:MAG: Ppx/GppA phosphatase family protein [Syntrophomonadaceae bacterium]|nr:Ppx/GppA phosphatase family protein [Syntrophomonadaceae bacterium]MDD4548938.1 Ppx/GppA phosphatase family protein [Syntrophomonadaceae bacterium]